MRSTAPTAACASSWKPAESATCWPSPATDRRRADPRRRPGRRPAPGGLAAALGRTRREGAALLRLGLARAAPSGSTRGRGLRLGVLVAADPPLAAHRRAGLLPLLSSRPGATDPA